MGISRDMRFVVETAIPAFCNERIRSAMLPPPVFTTVPSVSSSALGDLRRDRSASAKDNPITAIYTLIQRVTILEVSLRSCRDSERAASSPPQAGHPLGRNNYKRVKVVKRRKLSSRPPCCHHCCTFVMAHEYARGGLSMPEGSGGVECSKNKSTKWTFRSAVPTRRLQQVSRTGQWLSPTRPTSSPHSSSCRSYPDHPSAAD